jgi:hypothetical protein
MIRSRRFQGEEGQILVIVMAFMMLFAILIPAILGLASSNLKATDKIRGQRETAWAADGAMDGAIQFVRVDPTRGGPGGTCPTFSTALNGETVTVTCERLGSVLDLDREIEFLAGIGGEQKLRAHVFFRDSTAGSGQPQVDVREWRYSR